MSLHLETQKRNYELEEVKHILKSRPVSLRDNPFLSINDGETYKKDESEDEDEVANDDKVLSSITHKLGQSDPLADFHMLENMMLNRLEFETWEAKKIKIFA